MSSSKRTPPQRSSPTGTANLPAILADFPQIDSLEEDLLDPWLEGVSRPSRRIRELRRRKRRRHDALLSELRTELARLHAEVEQTVAFLTNNIKTELDKASHMVRLKGEEVKEAQVEFDAGVSHSETGLTEHGRFKAILSAAWETVSQLTEQRRRAIDALYDLLLEVEDGRCNSARASIDKYHELMARVDHLETPQLHILIAKEIKALNEAHLRNVISYGDLRFCLSRHADRDLVRFRDRVQSARRQSKEKSQRATLMLLQEAANRSTDECVALTAQGRRAARHFRQRVELLQARLMWSQPYPFPASRVAEWLHGVTAYLSNLEKGAESMVSALRDGLEQQKQLCIDEMERLRTVLLQNDLCSSLEIENIQESAYQPIISHISQRQEKEPAELMCCWKNALGLLEREIEEFASLLKGAGELWDNHCMRRESHKRKILQKVQEQKDMSGGSVEVREHRLNSVISRAKQETSPQALQELMLRINRILDDINSSYQASYTQVENTVQQYSASVNYEHQILMNEASSYFEAYPMPKEVISDINTNADFFGFPDQAVKHLTAERIRLWVEIEEFHSRKSSTELICSGEEWIIEVLEKLKEDYQNHQSSNKLRKEILHEEVEHTRLNELKEHTLLLESRSEEIKHVMEKLCIEMGKINEEEYKIFSDMSLNLKRITEEGLYETDWSRVEDLVKKAEEEFSQSENNVNNLQIKFEEYTQSEFSYVCEGNNKFMSTLKPFSKEGNFADSELKEFQARFEKLEKELKSKGEELCKSLAMKSHQCCKHARKYLEKCFKELQQHLDELLFTRDVTILVQKTRAQLKEQTWTLKNGGKVLKQQVDEIKIQEFDVNDAANQLDQWRGIVKSSLQRQQLLLELTNESSIETNIANCWSLIPYNIEGQGFLSGVYFCLKGSLLEAEKTAQEFYKTRVNKGILKTGTTLGHIDCFMINIGSKYRHYQEQCIDAWIYELKDYLDLIFNLVEKSKRLIFAAVSGHYESLVLKLNERETHLRVQIDQLRTYHRNLQMELMEKLSPLHCFPNNQQVLDLLYSDFERSINTLSKCTADAVSSYTKNLKEYRNEYKKKLSKTKMMLQKVLEGLLVKELIVPLHQRLEAQSKYFNSLPTLHKQKIASFENQNKNDRNALHNIDFEQINNADTPWRIKEYADLLSNAASKLAKTLNLEKNGASSEMSEILVMLNTMANDVKNVDVLLEKRGTAADKLQQQQQDIDHELRIKWRSGLETIQSLAYSLK